MWKYMGSKLMEELLVLLKHEMIKIYSLIKSLEWMSFDNSDDIYPSCPICGNLEITGHRDFPKCDLSEILVLLEEKMVQN